MINDAIPATSSYVLIDAHAEIDLEQAAQLLRSTFWAADMTAEMLAVVLERSVAVAARHQGATRLAGFARAISDGVTFAYLTDVVVDEDHRDRGLARRLSEALLHHPKLASVKHWALLASHERVSLLYKDLGFERTSHQHAWMERFAEAAPDAAQA